MAPRRKPKAKTTTSASSGDGFWFDESAAEMAAEFFSRYLTHVKGEWAGQPLDLSEWQKDRIIHPLFGCKRPDGTRRYRTAYIEIPRKNAKSTMCAGIALLLLFADKEPGAEIYSAAADREQAAIVFDAAKQMVEASPELRKRCEIYRRSIVIPATGSSYKVLSADAFTKHGLNAHGIIFDELHAQPNRELWDVLKTSTGARRQPLVVAITTAGYDRHSICWEQHDYAEKVRDGVIQDTSFLPVIYAAGPEDDWKNPETWAKANPGLGISIKPEYLAQEAKRAAEVAAYENTFKRLHLNIWTEQSERWLALDKWDACGEGIVNPDELEGRFCYAGLDLASTTDIAAFVMVFPHEDGLSSVLARFWVPEEGIRKRAHRDRVPYDLWAKQGHITPTEGDVIDYDQIRADIAELAKLYNIREIAFDRWGAAQISTQLQGDGLTVVPMGQGFASMSPPTKELEKLILGRQLRHGGNPVLRWMASNVAVKQDPAGNLKPAKDKSAERIDGIVALIMAIDRASRHEAADGESVYDTRGVLTL